MAAPGLRDRKAARTRLQIVEAALDLFIARGFDETTMEEIAERAEIGSSTLYRYFPSKDLVILDPLLSFTAMADFLRDRPAEEPLSEALAAVITSALTEFSHDGRLAEVRRIVDASPSPRARLWDVMATSRDDLEHALADRLGVPSTDLSVVLTARNAMIVYELAAEAWWAGDHSRDVADVVAEVLAGVRKATISLPG
jgi:AcrR family transcriptional regulator